MGPRVRRRIATVLVVALGPAGSCGAESEPGAGEDRPEITGRAGPSFAERLELLPQSLLERSGQVSVQMADLDRAAALAAVERPTDPADRDANQQYLRALQGAAGIQPDVAALLSVRFGVHGAARPEEFAAELGWSPAEVAWYVESANPLAQVTVLGSGFDVDRLAGAMGEPDHGVWQLGDPDHGPDPSRATAARPMGEPLWLALDGDLLIVSSQDWLFEDTRSDGPTLAEVPELVALAEAMDTEQVYSALVEVGGSYRPREPVPVHHQLEPFQGVAAGLAYDGDQPDVVLAYAHDDATAADANAEVVRTLVQEASSYAGEPWSDQLAVEEIRVDGTTVVTRLALRDTHPAAGYDLLRNREALATHG